MNLHQIAADAISAVNPYTTITLNQSTGYTVNADFSRTPTSTQITAQGQVQAFTAKELEHLNALNIQGVLRKVYLNGDWQGVVTSMQKGGDVMTFSSGLLVNKNWLVVHVFETWPDWCSVAVCLQ